MIPQDTQYLMLKQQDYENISDKLEFRVKNFSALRKQGGTKSHQIPVVQSLVPLVLDLTRIDFRDFEGDGGMDKVPGE